MYGQPGDAMKRAALLRRTELRSKSRPKPWKRHPDDKVSEELAHYVIGRDRVCVLSVIDATHTCRNTWGDEVPSNGDFELDHVDTLGFGKRGPSVPWNLVRLCPWGHREKTENARLYRPALREYLMRVEGRNAA